MNLPCRAKISRIGAVALVVFSLLVAGHVDTTSRTQAEPPPPGQAWPASFNSFITSIGLEIGSIPHVSSDVSNYINQAAEQNKDKVIQNVGAMLDDNLRLYDEGYAGLHTFGGSSIEEQLCENIFQLFWKFLTNDAVFVFASIACVLFFPNRRKRRSLSNRTIMLVCLMAVVGFAFHQSW